jgi:iron(II)-dependent oxidoreductase
MKQISIAIFFALYCNFAAAAVDPPEMVIVPAGAFTMGRNDGPDDERPAHVIHLPAFEIDRLPVTNEQFAEFLNFAGVENSKGERIYDFDDSDARIHQLNGHWRADRGYENHPAVEPAWAGARDYCAWRGKRLPTEAERAKAARGNDDRRYPWGNDMPDDARAQFGKRFNETAPVDRFPSGASPYGALDMAGNTWEWVSSAYKSYPYRANDGREDLNIGPARGTRGGGHDSTGSEITTTQRGRTLSRNPRAGHHNIGFRCAR